MGRIPRRFLIHLLLAGGHTQLVEFETLEDFQQWYGEVLATALPEALVSVPLRGLQLEYLLVRAGSVIGIRVEPEFGASQE
jgi:hypothetical protein